MIPQFRYTLFHNTLAPGGITFSDPDGWKDAELVLQRDTVFFSLVEAFEGEFVFHGAARDFILSVEGLDGPDAQLRILIEISFKIQVFEEVFDGLLKVVLMEDIELGTKKYRYKIPITRNDSWSKFFNRKETKVDLLSTVDLDGNARALVDKFTLSMPSQVINGSYHSRQDDTFANSWFDIPNNGYAAIDLFEEVLRDSLDEIFTLGLNGIPSLPAPKYVAKYGGLHSFDISIHLSEDGGGVTPVGIGVYIKKNEEAEILFSSETISDIILGDHSRWYYTGGMTLNASDKIRLYIKNTTGGTISLIGWAGLFYESYIKINGATVYITTSADAFLLPDAFRSNLSKICGADDVLVSDYLDSCKGLYSVQFGKHIRGYSMADKPFAPSFMDLWNGSNPAFCLGAGYDKIDGVDKIRIENRGYFYDPETSLELTGISDIVRTYDLDLIFKQIEIGYDKWSAESSGGIDDPQTKHNYRTKFAKIGKDEKLLSKFIAASLAIEQTRRYKIQPGKDWKLDEEIIIIALKLVDDDYVPEVGADFDLISNLNNSDTRINIRLSVARNFKRWQDWFDGCLAPENGDKFYFTSGEGNTTMVSKLPEDDCDASDDNELAEDQDIASNNSGFGFPIKREFKCPLSWSQYKTIRDNRTKAIGIEINGQIVAHFISRMSYKPMDGIANFVVTLSSNWFSTENTDDAMLWQDLIPMAWQDGVLMQWQQPHRKIFDLSHDLTFE